MKRTFLAAAAAIVAVGGLLCAALSPSLPIGPYGRAALGVVLLAALPIPLLFVRRRALWVLRQLSRAVAPDVHDAASTPPIDRLDTADIESIAFRIQALNESFELCQLDRHLAHERLRLLFDGSPVGLVLVDTFGTVLEYNDSMHRLTGWTHSEALDLASWIELVCSAPDQREPLDRLASEMRSGAEVKGTWSLRITHRSGLLRDVLLYAESILEAGIDTRQYLLTFVDVTTRRKVEEELHLLARAIDTTRLGLTVTDLAGRILYTNTAEAEMHGRRVGDLLGKDVRILAPPALWSPLSIDAIQSIRTRKRESLNIRQDGTTFPVRLISDVVHDPAGAPIGIVTSCEDITEQKRVEQAFRDSEERYRDLVESSIDPILTHDLEGVILSGNRALVEFLGQSSPEAVVGHRIDEFLHPGTRHLFPAYLAEVRQRGRADGLMKVALSDGRERVMEYHNSVRPETPPIIRSMSRDVTERWRAERALRRAKEDLEAKVEERTQELSRLNEQLVEDIRKRQRVEAALRDSERRFRTLFEDAPVGIYRTTPDGRVVLANAKLIAMLGCGSFEELASLDLSHAGFAAADEASRFRLLLEQDGEVSGLDAMWTRADGRVISVRENARAIRADNGTVLCYQGVVEDITDRKKLEEQLRQSMKMEALGRLAGGVAHDFNNILTGIIGYSDLMIGRLKEGDPLRRHATEVRRAGERASTLTRQLLAFSRKQIIQPKLHDLNTIITDLERMLRRLIGEDIRLLTELEPDLGYVHADRGQMEQVIMNLVVNARDAMPDGGTITIRTSKVTNPSGPEQVRLTIADTGSGMSADVKAHLFEPFFTTKERGTGLGLSTVYGIISQSKGTVRVHSEPGEGTRFDVLLPKSAEAQPADGTKTSTPESLRGNEVVLVVEDDEAVRGIAQVSLATNGYHVMVASHAEEALSMSGPQAGPIHIMVTDVVMPGMSGRELADRLAGERPGMKVLFVSGYTDDQILRHGVLDHGIAFLQKPFSPEMLVRKVRDVLDGRA